MNFKLHIFKDNQPVQNFLVQAGQNLSIGRQGSGAGIALADEKVSRQHAEIFAENGKLYIRDIGSSNGTYIGQTKIEAQRKYALNGGDTVWLSKSHCIKIEAVASNFPSPKPNPDEGNKLNSLLQSKNRIVIGRASDCDIILNSMVVSRQHAIVHKDSSGVSVEVVSSNGVFINNTHCKKGSKNALKSKDILKIGSFMMGIETAIANIKTRSKEAAIIAEGIEKRYPNGYIGLQRMSLNIRQKEFVALMGPSGCGKSTLLKCLNAAEPATAGTIKINGLNLISDYDQIKRSIGYVPQDDIVHKDLSLADTMYYAAKLRLADDISDGEMNNRIQEVLKSLNIDYNALAKNKIGELSGGQRKRISIAVEMLNEPTILFLDEPTSPLDPETIDEFLKCIRNLADEHNITVVMVTHKPDDLEYVDRVIFLSKGGYLTYFGEKHELTTHFNAKNLIEVYKQHNSKEQGKQFNQTWNQNPKSQFILPQNTYGSQKTNSSLRQLYWLTRRYFSIKASDKPNLILLLAQPVIIAMLLGFSFKNLQVGVLFMVAVSAIWFGVSNAAKEIVGEMPIYMRERMYNVSIINYLLSKIGVLSIIALVQVLIFVFILSFFFGKSGETLVEKIRIVDYPNYVGFMFLLSASATLLGLLLSSIFKTTEQVMTVVPIALIPQIMLAGVITKIDSQPKELMSYVTLGRWGTEGFARIQDNSHEDFVAFVDTLVVLKAADKSKRPKAPSYDTLLAYKDTVVAKPPKAKKISQDFALDKRGIVNRIPVFEASKDTFRIEKGGAKNGKDTLLAYMNSHEKDTVTNALDLLDFYGYGTQKTKPLAWADSFNENLFAILLLNLVVFIGLFFSLKFKDKI